VEENRGGGGGGEGEEEEVEEIWCAGARCRSD
jgi:hypothetical protein